MVLVLVVLVVAALGVGGFFAYKKFFAPAAPESLPGAGQQAAVEQPGAMPSGGEPPARGEQPATPSPEPASPAPAPAAGQSTSRGISVGRRVSTPPPAAAPSTPVASEPPAPAPSAPPASPAPVETPAAAPVQEQRRVEILKPETPIPQEAPRQAAPPVKPAYSGPPSGVVLWSGRLDKNGSVTIDGNSASFGNLNGALPGVPIMIEVDQREFALAETPSPSNGWKRITIRSRSKRHSVVTIKWSILK
jgi:hypothetical protein